MTKLTELYWERDMTLKVLRDISNAHPDGDYTKTITKLLELEKEIQRLLKKTKN